MPKSKVIPNIFRDTMKCSFFGLKPKTLLDIFLFLFDEPKFSLTILIYRLSNKLQILFNNLASSFIYLCVQVDIFLSQIQVIMLIQ